MKAHCLVPMVALASLLACGDDTTQATGGGGSTGASPTGASGGSNGSGPGPSGSGGAGAGGGSATSTGASQTGTSQASAGGTGAGQTGGGVGGDGSGGASSSTGGGTPSYCNADIENMQGGEPGDGVTVTGFPACIGFATDDYEDLHVVWLSAGATHEFVPDAGWNGGGAARFTPPGPAQANTGLGQFHVGSHQSRHLSMRWLMKQGPTFGQYSSGNKTLIFVREPNDDAHPRPMIITREGPPEGSGRTVPGACDGTVCQYHVAPGSKAPWFPDGSDTFWIGDGGYEEQWVSWEFEVDLDEQWIRLYLTTTDGVFSDTLYNQNDFIDGQSTEFDGFFNYIDVLGGNFTDDIPSDPGNWWMIDELVVSDAHIGPPEGFVE